MAQHPPAWMEALVNIVVDCMEAHSPMGSVGWQYHEEEALGELVVYPTPVELVGGATDGAVVATATFNVSPAASNALTFTNCKGPNGTTSNPCPATISQPG